MTNSANAQKWHSIRLRWLALVGVGSSPTLLATAHRRMSGVQCADRLSITMYTVTSAG